MYLSGEARLGAGQDVADSRAFRVMARVPRGREIRHTTRMCIGA